MSPITAQACGPSEDTKDRLNKPFRSSVNGNLPVRKRLFNNTFSSLDDMSSCVIKETDMEYSFSTSSKNNTDIFLTRAAFRAGVLSITKLARYQFESANDRNGMILWLNEHRDNWGAWGKFAETHGEVALWERFQAIMIEDPREIICGYDVQDVEQNSVRISALTKTGQKFELLDHEFCTEQHKLDFDTWIKSDKGVSFLDYLPVVMWLDYDLRDEIKS